MNNESLTKLHFLNVGQGDCIICQFPGDHVGIIDCNCVNGYPALKILQEINDRELSFIFLTHPHVDHITGLSSIFNYYTKNGRRIKKFFCHPIDLAVILKCDNYTLNTISYNFSDSAKEELSNILEIIHKNNIREIPITHSAGYIKIFNDKEFWISPISPQLDDFWDNLQNRIETEKIFNLNEISIAFKLIIGNRTIDAYVKNQRALLAYN